MRLLFASLLASLLFTSTSWETDFDKAKATARSEHKYILVNFSGSDWCGPCIKMHKDIFEQVNFTQYASDHLVLVNADFPRMSKHALSKEQQKKNDQLAEQYNKDGIFPMTVLLNADGKVLRKWEGLPRLSADAFTGEVKAIVDAGK